MAKVSLVKLCSDEWMPLALSGDKSTLVPWWHRAITWANIDRYMLPYSVTRSQSVNMSLYLNWTQKCYCFQGDVTYTPRLIAVDLKGKEKYEDLYQQGSTCMKYILLHLQIDCKKLAYFYHQYPFQIMVLSMSHSMGLEMKYEMMQPVNYRSLSTIQMVVDRLESCLVMGGLSWLKTGAAGILGPGSLWGLSV